MHRPWCRTDPVQYSVGWLPESGAAMLLGMVVGGFMLLFGTSCLCTATSDGLTVSQASQRLRPSFSVPRCVSQTCTRFRTIILLG